MRAQTRWFSAETATIQLGVADKYSEWKTFILEVKNVLSTYNVREHDKIAIVKKWLGRKGCTTKKV